MRYLMRYLLIRLRGRTRWPWSSVMRSVVKLAGESRMLPDLHPAIY
jgi:hypothetical protein